MSPLNYFLLVSYHPSHQIPATPHGSVKYATSRQTAAGNRTGVIEWQDESRGENVWVSVLSSPLKSFFLVTRAHARNGDLLYDLCYSRPKNSSRIEYIDGCAVYRRVNSCVYTATDCNTIQGLDLHCVWQRIWSVAFRVALQYCLVILVLYTMAREQFLTGSK